MAEAKEKLVKIEALTNGLGKEENKIGAILEVPEEVAEKLIEKGLAKKATAKK